MATLHIDQRDYTIGEGKNALEACLELGFDLPYFCWHPAMGSVGACRQCAVRQYKGADDEQGTIVMACMTPAADGARLSVHDPEAVDMRARVIEWLMANHPHDCPVCEEGGECHLQDMTVMTGHTYRRYRFGKRTHRNQYLGPFINHEMNRCIACYRCVRFYRGYAGGTDLDALGVHHHVYFGRHADGTLENEFSGNLVEVCPTGVFTDKPFSEVYTRRWDLRSAPSICLQCGVGCNITPGERYGQLKRVQNRYHEHVNGYFLCDRGRFGHGYVHHPQRLRQPAMRPTPGETPRPLTGLEALGRLRDWVGDGSAIGIGSPRASVETNFALRELVGRERYSTGMAAPEQRLVERIRDIVADGRTRVPTLPEMTEADALLVLGEDVTNTAPRIALALRQTARSRARSGVEQFGVPWWKDNAVRETMPFTKTPFYLLSPHATRLDDAATATWRGAPDDLARIGHAVAHALDPEAPAVADLDEATQTVVDAIVADLQTAQRPLIVSGIGTGSEAVIDAATHVAHALASQDRRADLCLTVPEANSLGVSLMGGVDVDRALDQVTAADALVIAENDLYRRADGARVDAALATARAVVVLDSIHHDTAREAGLLLPAGTFAEADGTVVNFESRAQRFFRVLPPEDDIRAGWAWLDEVATGERRALDAVIADCAERIPALAAIREAAPGADYRLGGMQLAREPNRYSGRTAMDAVRSVSEPKPPSDANSPMTFTMEGRVGGTREAAPLLPFIWAARGNTVKSLNKFQAEIDGPLTGGEGGVRLFEPTRAGDGARYPATPPAAFQPGADGWRLVPRHHIFGSEVLSAYSPPLAERIPAPYVALHPTDAESLGVAAGEALTLELDAREHRLPLHLDDTLVPGTAGVPVGLPDGPAPILPDHGGLRREGA